MVLHGDGFDDAKVEGLLLMTTPINGDFWEIYSSNPLKRTT
jgi:hypothetical protein